MIVTSSAPMASITRRACAGSLSIKNATPRFSLRASALAAPKKLDPTMRPRATSSDHSTGALNRKRSSTDTQTTKRSAASMIAATASLNSNSEAVIRWPPLGESAATVIAASRLCRADHVDHRFRLGAGLDEIVGLRQHALAERFLVAFDDGDAFFQHQPHCFLLDGEAMGAAVGGGLLCGIEKTLAQFRVHAVEGDVTEIDRKRREDVLRQRVVLRGLEELAGDDGRRIVLEPVEHA